MRVPSLALSFAAACLAPPAAAQMSIENVFACVATCPNGYMKTAPQCRFGDDCAMPFQFGGAGGNAINPEDCGCSDWGCMQNVMSFDAYEYPRTASGEAACNKFLSFLNSVHTAKDATTTVTFSDTRTNSAAVSEKEVGELQCSCSDVAFQTLKLLRAWYEKLSGEELNQVPGTIQEVCELVVDKAKDKAQDFMCAKRFIEKVPLLNKAADFCDDIFDSSTFEIVTDGFTGLCTGTLTKVLKWLGMEKRVSELLKKLKDEAEASIEAEMTRMSNTACGTVACISGNTKGCMLVADPDSDKALVAIQELPEEVCDAVDAAGDLSSKLGVSGTCPVQVAATAAAAAAAGALVAL